MPGVGELVADRFRLEAQLGRGASGTVFRAYDAARGSRLAVKFLASLDPGSLFRFKSEFRTLSGLAHPNLLQLYELIRYRKTWLLTMELVEGSNFLQYVRPPLHEETERSVCPGWPLTETDGVTATSPQEGDTTAVGWLRSPLVRRATMVRSRGARRHGPLDAERLSGALRQLCTGLSVLHGAGRLHRDLKPANVLVNASDGRVIICDFGLALEGEARRARGADVPGLPPPEDVANGAFGVRGDVAGTLAFMAPEQIEGSALTPASDWYAVGVMLYQALTGDLPVHAAMPPRRALAAKRCYDFPHPCRLSPAAPRDLSNLAMALLQPDGHRRAGPVQALEVLEGGKRRRRSSLPPTAVLRGRAQQLGELMRAYRESRSGSPVLAMVTGPAGMGKSALVHHFLDRLEQEEDAVVLRARCYERESLPFKALDPLMDALGSYLVTLPSSEVAAWMPRSVPHLAALFPALGRVAAIADLCKREALASDPRERHRLAFVALRAVCRALSERAPLVLFVDDLQWGDMDSLALFSELLCGANQPSALLACAYRSEDEQRSPLLVALRERYQTQMRVASVRVDSLSKENAAALAHDLLRASPHAGASDRDAGAIANEAAGSPLLVRQLAAHVVARGALTDRKVELRALVSTQLGALPPERRKLVCLVALSGRPVRDTVLARAADLEDSLLGALRALEGMRLLTATDWGTGLRVECSHNRIREVACDQLGADEARDLHRALATTLEALVDEHGGWEPALEKMPDCEALLEHWIGAGDCAKTVQYARLGAERALSAHAFERAVSLYRVALSSLSPLHPRARALREGLANALTLAGRGGEAARVFLGLIPGASRQDALRYRTLATCQLLRGGELEAGFVELVRAERHLQVRFPRSGAEALARLVPHRVRNRCAETRLTAGIPGLAAGELGVHMGVLWEVAAAVSCADFARGSVYAAELLRRAVQAGDSEHIAAACGLEAVNAVCENRMARAERMIALSERAAARCGDPELIARVRGMHGICRQLQGRWLQAVRLCRESQQQLERLERLNWDYTMMSWFELVAAAPSGRVGELVTRVPSALRRAQARGDVYGATSFRTHRASWAWLGVDKPLEADAQVDIAERDWVPRGFQFQHWYMLFSRSEIDLYRGTPHRALELMEDAWPRARFLRLVRPVRVDMLFTRARLLLAAARANYRPVLVRRARADGLALLRDGQAWSIALGELVLALAASFSSKREALQRLERAERCLIDADMLMHVYAVRARRGQWQGGAAGDALAETALGGARSLGAGRPAAFVDLLAP